MGILMMVLALLKLIVNTDDGSHHPDTTKKGELDHFLYRKDSRTTTIESWTATGQIQEFWRFQKDWYDTHNEHHYYK